MHVLLTSTALVALAEIGDQTQLATVALAARYADLPLVVAGTTLGILLANVPAVLLGDALATRLPLRPIRWGAAVLFFALGVATLVTTPRGHRPTTPARSAAAEAPAR